MVATIRNRVLVPRKRVAVRTKRLYDDSRWSKYALAWIKQYPYCVLCLCMGRVNKGASDYAVSRQRNLVVDHITPHRGDMELFWDDANHETLCRYPCHDSDKSRHEHQCKSTSQWFDYLAQLIVDNESWDHVQACGELVSPNVMEQLNVRR